MTPRNQIALARSLLAVGALACGAAMIGPFQGVEEVLVPWDKAAHFLAFYAFTIGLFLAFPQRRRIDLAMLAIFLGAGTEAAQGLAGRDCDVLDMIADALGVIAVLAPIHMEQWRSQLRPSGAQAIIDRRGAAPAAVRRPATSATVPQPVVTSH
jgi:VanZ family protein